MIQHIFLTGQVQIGKSTALRQFFAGCPCNVGGYRTFWEGDTLIFRLLGAQAAQLALAQRSADGMQINKAAFTAAGAMLSAEDTTQYGLLCFDELGYMERCSPEFQRAVLTLLNGKVPVVGVLRLQTDGPFWEVLHRRSDTKIWMVTKENRDGIPAQLAEQYPHGAAYKNAVKKSVPATQV